MTRVGRRQFLYGSVSGFVLATPFSKALAQANSPEVQRDYARVFQAQSGKATPLFDALRRAQERRTPAPTALEAFRDFVRKSETLRALDTFKVELKNKGISLNSLPLTALQPNPQDQLDIAQLAIWNEAIANLTALDHTTKAPDQTPSFYGEQFGPPRTARVYAMMYLAVFEAVGTIIPRYPTYRDLRTRILAAARVSQAQVNRQSASLAQAIATASSAILVTVYPKKKQFIEAYLVESESRIGDDGTPDRVLGRAIGKAAADAVLAERKFDPTTGLFADGSNQSDGKVADFDTSDATKWQQDPISMLTPALGSNWAQVLPFAISAADQFRPVPPDLASADFIANYKDVKLLGAAGLHVPTQLPRWPTPTTRTGQNSDGTIAAPLDRSNQTFVGIYWGYDGTALLCAPLRLYNMIANSVAMNERPIGEIVEYTRYLALINVAMADAGIGSWEAKYHYRLARPVTYIRKLDVDQTPEGRKNDRWTPLGAPVTNGTVVGRNLTPPFPAYPSGHATFGAALFQMMANYWSLQKDDGATKFTFVSDEFNGENRGPGDIQPRPKQPVEFPNFAAAEHDNAQSRIYVGVHWQIDAEAGIKQGSSIADEVFKLYKDRIPDPT